MYKTVDKTIYKQAFSPETLIRCWNECLDKSSFHSRRIQVEEFNKKNYWKKKGIAIIPMKFSVGFAATSYHQVKLLYVENNPHVRCTATPISSWWFWESVICPRHWAPPSLSTWEKCTELSWAAPSLQAHSTQCSRKMSQWQKMASASLRTAPA